MYYTMCLSYHSNAEAVLFACLLSDWVITMSRLFGPKVGNSIKSICDDRHHVVSIHCLVVVSLFCGYVFCMLALQNTAAKQLIWWRACLPSSSTPYLRRGKCWNALIRFLHSSEQQLFISFNVTTRSFYFWTSTIQAISINQLVFLQSNINIKCIYC